MAVNFNLQTPRKQRGWIQLVGLAIAAVGAGMQAKAAHDQRKARRGQQYANRLRNFQAKRQFMRNFKVAQAEALARGIAGGGDPRSSYTQATLASQTAQARTASRDFREFDRIGQQASAYLDSAARAQFGANLLSTAASFAMSDAGSDFLKNLGGGSTPPPSGTTTTTTTTTKGIG